MSLLLFACDVMGNKCRCYYNLEVKVILTKYVMAFEYRNVKT